MLWLRRLVAGVPSQRPGLDPKSVYEICGEQSVTGKSIFQSSEARSVKAIQPMHHTHLDHNILLSEGEGAQTWEPAKIAVFFGISKRNGLTSTSTLSQLEQVSSG